MACFTCIVSIVPFLTLLPKELFVLKSLSALSQNISVEQMKVIGELYVEEKKKQKKF